MTKRKKPRFKCNYCEEPLPVTATVRARWCRPSCRQRGYELRKLRNSMSEWKFQKWLTQVTGERVRTNV